MAVVFAYPAAGTDLSQLLDELLAAGLAPERVENRIEVTVVPPAGPGDLPREERALLVDLTFADGQARAPVDAVVAAHVPRVRYDPATRLAAVAALRRAAARQALVERARAAATVDALRDVVLAHLRAEQEEEAEA